MCFISIIRLRSGQGLGVRLGLRLELGLGEVLARMGGNRKTILIGWAKKSFFLQENSEKTRFIGCLTGKSVGEV